LFNGSGMHSTLVREGCSSSGPGSRGGAALPGLAILIV
jgi:hypothetical protein